MTKRDEDEHPIMAVVRQAHPDATFWQQVAPYRDAYTGDAAPGETLTRAQIAQRFQAAMFRGAPGGGFLSRPQYLAIFRAQRSVLRDDLLQHLTRVMGSEPDARTTLQLAEDALFAEQDERDDRRDVPVYPGRDDSPSVADVFSMLDLDAYLAWEHALDIDEHPALNAAISQAVQETFGLPHQAEGDDA